MKVTKINFNTNENFPLYSSSLYREVVFEYRSILCRHPLHLWDGLSTGVYDAVLIEPLEKFNTPFRLN